MLSSTLHRFRRKIARSRVGRAERYPDRKSRLTRFVLEAESARQLFTKVLGDLAPETFERFFDRLLVQNVSRTIWNMVRQDLQLALRKARRRLRYPVSDFLRDIRSVQVEVKRQKLFDADLIRERIFDETLPIESRAWAAFIFFIACRPNEMMALQWSDIDWKKGVVTICKALAKAEHGFEVKGSTKTGRNDDREAPLGSFLADALRRIQRCRMSNGTNAVNLRTTPKRSKRRPGVCSSERAPRLS